MGFSVTRLSGAATIVAMICLFSAIGPSPASATLVFYSLTFNVDGVSCANGGTYPTGCNEQPAFGPEFGNINPGDIYTGHFAVDSSILSTAGINSAASIFDFYLQYGPVGVYAQPLGTSLLFGFRNIHGFAAAPSFLIENGQVVDIMGDVYGGADFPYVDFDPSGLLTEDFVATDTVQNSFGTYSVARIPEPGSLAMFGAGLAALGLMRRRRRPS